MPPTRLSTPRLTLRPLRDDDAPALAAYRNEPDIARFQGWGAAFSLEQARQLIAAMQGREPGQPGWFQFGIADHASDQLLGDLGLHSFELRHAEIGFTLAPGSQGRGLAQEAVGAVLALAFEQLDRHRVVAFTDPRNRPAARLLGRLGFRHEGRQLESHFDGTSWLDEDQHALLHREWQAHSALHFR